MPYVSPAAVVSGAVISKTTFGDVVKADLDYLANPPACRVYHNTTQLCADAADTIVAFNSERWDTDVMHDTVTNNSRVTIKTAGLYLLTFSGLLTSLTTYSQVNCYFRLNGATPLGYQGYSPTTFNMAPELSNTTVFKFAVNDYIQVLVYQDNTANTAQNLLTGANYSPEFSATWLGLG